MKTDVLDTNPSAIQQGDFFTKASINKFQNDFAKKIDEKLEHITVLQAMLEKAEEELRLYQRKIKIK